MVEIKTTGELQAMREAGRVVARTLQAVAAHATPGTPIAELDDLAATTIAEAHATSAFTGYQPGFAPTPYPAVICVSVNDAIVHGIPGRSRLRDGDLVSIDCGVYLDGWAGDSAISFTVGTTHPADRHLIDTTRQALAAGIAAALPGNRIGDIGHAIQTVAARDHCTDAVASDFGGHGIGRHMHEDPHVPNRGRPGRGMILRPGMTLAIEPMLSRSPAGYRVASDGWTLRTTDGSRAAHAEHTIAITDDGPLILTAP
ncbi:type I methionyl aminopeptidase [Nonomuraea sp. CA-218870]|uniref:type I methionyl aminopeptidase n=1 Tax=Nonomuraea sp. CA-218870 TaxID=3239998 RepID=UPI003D8E10EA